MKFKIYMLLMLVVFLNACTSSNSEVKKEEVVKVEKKSTETKKQDDKAEKLKKLMMTLNKPTPTVEIKELPEGVYPPESPVAINGKLSIKDGQLVNEQGKPVQLKGMSSYALQSYGEFMNDANIGYLANDWKVDIVRAAMYTEMGGYIADRSIMNKVVEIADICEKYGIYCLIDWHILRDGDPTKYTEEAKEFFRNMATMYKNKKHVLYELCNEPNGNDVKWANKIKPYAEQVIPEIRAIDKDGIIIVGTGTWSQDVDDAAKSPLEGNNIMYTLHFYAGTHGEDLRVKANVALSKGLPLFITEWGVSKATGDDGVFIEESDIWLDWADKNNISWTNWSFCNQRETSAALNLTASKSKNVEDFHLSESGRYVRSRILKDKQ